MTWPFGTTYFCGDKDPSLPYNFTVKKNQLLAHRIPEEKKRKKEKYLKKERKYIKEEKYMSKKRKKYIVTDRKSTKKKSHKKMDKVVENEEIKKLA